MILAALLLQISSVATGEKIFAQNCSVGYCHGAAGAAAKGPRLRGRSFEKNYLYSAIRDGIPKSAMPAWKDRLKEDEIQATVAYIQSLSTADGDVVPVVPDRAAGTAEAFPVSATVARGRDLFFGPNGCGSCHTVGGRGTTVGPDVTKVPKEQVPAAIRSDHSRLVRTVKLKDGEAFPALIGAEDKSFVQLFDLTSPPPVRRTLERREILSTGPAVWSHQSVAASYSPEQISDIIEFIRSR